MAKVTRESPRIPWDHAETIPVLQLKYGITRKRYPLELRESRGRFSVVYDNPFVRLDGKWREIPGFGSCLSFRLTNISDETIRITRLIFPAENALNWFTASSNRKDISFFRNGYQSWSTARSYRPQDKPLRPWLQLVSLASSNMANLPSNEPGLYSSEMYAIITSRAEETSFLVGQGRPFHQFLYIRLHLHTSPKRRHNFEIIYDFGRKMIRAGESIELDEIYFAVGDTHRILQAYFQELSLKNGIELPRRNIHGWCSWYFYYNKISPDIIRSNIRALARARDETGAKFDFVQIDDGYQRAVGDWLDLVPAFDGRMKLLSDEIRNAGFSPGLWISPFIAARKSKLLAVHPEYALRDEHGRLITAGFNFFWPGRYYTGLDITNPLFEEYIRKVIRTMVGDWGYPYLKCDFLFGGCLRGGTHNNLELSRAEVLRRGMEIIREEAQAATKENVFIVGCGMPLTTGIDLVDAMRIGPDTGSYWINRKGSLLRTGAMVGVRNSIRNSLVRSAMHNALWLNDPDCVMLRRDGTRLSEPQRRFQINVIALTGGLLLYSDDFTLLSDRILEELPVIQAVSDACFEGRLIPYDMMDRELPEIVLNTSGYLGIFNSTGTAKSITVPIHRLMKTAEDVCRVWNQHCPSPRLLTEVWSGEKIRIDGTTLIIGPLQKYESRLFRFER